MPFNEDNYKELEYLVAKVSEMEKFTQRLEAMLLESQVKTLAILKALPYLMFELSRDGTHLDFYSENTRKLFLEPEDFIGKKVTEVLPGKAAEQYMLHIEKALDTGKIQNFSYDLVFPEGRRQYAARIVVSGYDKVLSIVQEKN